MTYDTREVSLHSGEPFELFLFELDGAAWHITSGDKERVHLGETYRRVAMSRSETSQGQEIKSGTIRITIPRDHEIADQFKHYLPASPMSVVIYRGHDGDPATEYVVHFTGFVTTARFTDSCELTVAPEQELLKRRIPAPEYQRRCNHILYDAGCGILRDDFKTVATVTFALGVTVKSAEFAALSSGWLDSGYLEKGFERRMILRHIGDTVQIITKFPGLQAGDVVNAFAGCARTAGVCVSKFNNLGRFLGFEFIPGKNPFRGVA